MAAKKKAPRKLPYWVLYFNCTPDPIGAGQAACVDGHDGPYATQKEAQEHALGMISQDEYSSAMVVQNVSVATLPQATAYFTDV